jgi:hypothetical protein
MKKFCIVLALACMCIFLEAQEIITAFPPYCLLNDMVGVVMRDTIVFYRNSTNGFFPAPELEFSLPQGYTDVIYFGRMIGVAVDGSLFFYQNDYTEWQESTDVMSLVLPKGYKKIFCSNTGDWVGVVIGNRVQFYRYGYGLDYTFQRAEYDLELPDGYTDVFGAGARTVGVVVANKVAFYCLPRRSRDGGWKALDYYYDLELPERYTSIFDMSHLNNLVYIGILIDGELLVYEFDKGTWQIINRFLLFG